VYLLLGMERAYGNIYTNPSDILKAPYDTLIPPFFNGNFDMDTVNQLLPANISGYVEDSVLQAFIADSINQQHPIWQALNKNTNYDWTPTMPLRMYYCTADEQVGFQNALDAETAMQANGASNVNAQLNGNLTHVGCITPSIAAASLFFDSLSTSCSSIVSLVENALRQMSIYPNPSQGKLYFETTTDIDELNITIFSSTGNVMLSKRHLAKEELDISSLPKAMYFVEVRAKESVQRMRILKR